MQTVKAKHGTAGHGEKSEPKGLRAKTRVDAIKCPSSVRSARWDAVGT